MSRETLGVSRKEQKRGSDHIRKKSDFVKSEQRRIEKLLQWTHTNLNQYTSGNELNAVWTAVAAAQDRWITFLHYVIPTGITARILMNPVMRLKLYKADGTEQYVTADLHLSMQKVGKSFVTEICSLGYYSRYYDVSWLSQMNRDYRDLLVVDTGYPTVMLWEGETLLFQVKNSGVAIPSTCHANTNFSFPIDVITNAEIARQIEAARVQGMRRQGIDVAD